MARRILLSCVTVLLLIIEISPAKAAAQTTGEQILHACYIPLVGVVYRIKAPGLPSACLAKTHVEFSWNAQGPKGDRGEAGPAGNLGLAGQDCPNGFWIAGFTATGALRCRNLAGQEPTDPPPPPPPPNPFSGTWTLTPNLTSHCTSAIGSGSITLSGLTTSVSETNQLEIVLRGSYEFTGVGAPLVIRTPSIPIFDLPTFPIDVSADGTATFTGPLFGTSTYHLTGQFSSLTSFSGSTEVTFTNLSVRLPGFLTDIGFSCTPVTGNVTGTRLP